MYKRTTINNNTHHLKSPKNRNRRAALGRSAIKLLGGVGGGGGGGGRGRNLKIQVIEIPWIFKHFGFRLNYTIVYSDDLSLSEVTRRCRARSLK